LGQPEVRSTAPCRGDGSMPNLDVIEIRRKRIRSVSRSRCCDTIPRLWLSCLKDDRSPWRPTSRGLPISLGSGCGTTSAAANNLDTDGARHSDAQDSDRTVNGAQWSCRGAVFPLSLRRRRFQGLRRGRPPTMLGVAGGQGSPMRSSRRGGVMTRRVAYGVRCTRSAHPPMGSASSPIGRS